MELLRVDPRNPDPSTIGRAADVIRRGGLVAFPTETVYGLGAHALDPAAVERIYEAKGRPSYNPIIVHVATAEQAHGVVREWNETADRLARAFWPGPITLVLAKRENVPDAVTAGLPTVGVRVPAHPVAHALLAAAGVPIAAPSANRSTQLSPTMAAHVVASLGDAVDVVLDGGPTWVGI
ncbi:MAG TPA: L-threonylcarbamoyladenylate synthase, partial [Gemmatimonadaceae bacterium]|nr:L-threonylcarbamoyladenylate synthase [Gemmatimonadaceae bacterium]